MIKCIVQKYNVLINRLLWKNILTYELDRLIKVLEKCPKNLIGHSRLAFNNHESNIDC